MILKYSEFDALEIKHVNKHVKGKQNCLGQHKNQEVH